jgi:hypothetical protein
LMRGMFSIGIKAVQNVEDVYLHAEFRPMHRSFLGSWIICVLVVAKERANIVTSLPGDTCIPKYFVSTSPPSAPHVMSHTHTHYEQHDGTRYRI